MIRYGRRRLGFTLLAAILLITLLHLFRGRDYQDTANDTTGPKPPHLSRERFSWKDYRARYPVDSTATLPYRRDRKIPQIQADFPEETFEERSEREERLNAVKEAFVHSWEGYKRHAWLQDEVSPLSGLYKNDFGGWGATFFDSLDTLWIMGLENEFASALSALQDIDLSYPSLYKLNVFETNIRFLGGLLGAYDVSGQKHPILLQKAMELGDMLYVAFDTPNGMPITRWDWKNAVLGGEQGTESFSLLAEIGSLTLEFTHLSQLSSDPKYYQAVTRVMDVFYEKQNHTRLPGLWPQLLDMRSNNFKSDMTFSMAGMSDSVYEYLPKQYLLLGGNNDQYREMYSTALEAAKDNLFFQPLNQHNEKILLAGKRTGFPGFNAELVPECEHLSCFTGGMVALASKIFHRPEELKVARQLVQGCVWAYESTPSRIMPESFRAILCLDQSSEGCTWSQQKWYDAVGSYLNEKASPWQPSSDSPPQVIQKNNLPPGFVQISDPSYKLRPEAIESLFVLYRITGDKIYQDKAWDMFQAINKITRTDIAFAAISDVTLDKPTLFDSMESFWTAETLKYFYLIFSTPDVISLDDYVLNTEAHPLLLPK